MTAKEIVESTQELWLNSPIGYEFVEKIEKSDLGRLKSFLINLFAQGDDSVGDAIRNASHEEVVQTFLNSNFTFDEQWYGYREIPKGIDGRPKSRLDDPDYQKKMGFRP